VRVRRGAVDASPPLPGVVACRPLAGRPWPPPWPGGARPSRAQGCDFRGSPRRCSRKRPPHRVGAVPQERVQLTEHTVAAEDAGESKTRERPTHTVLLGDHYCMRYPVDAHRPSAVASRGEQAVRMHEGTDSHGLAVAACSHRARDLPAPEHSRLAITATKRRGRPRGRVTRLRRPSRARAPRAL
jgi:hypothetical protein